MPHWMRALLLLAAADAWRPPHLLLLTPDMPKRVHRDLSNHTHYLTLHGWRLQLQENRAIRSPYYNECKFYKGSVINEDNSTATVTECEGHLYGLLQIGGEGFVLQPTRTGSGGHVLRRRDVLLAEQPVVFNLTDDTVANLDLDLEDEPPQPHVRARYSNYVGTDTDYFRSMTPVTRPVSGVNSLWLEMAIIADNTIVKFHGRERVNHYILALMNIVSAIFNDPSLGSNMTLVINKLYVYEEKKDSVMHHGNPKKSLDAANKWNSRHLLKLPAGNTEWDAAVWLTRVPLGGPSGYAPLGGICSRDRSAAIIRDEGLISAFVVAHELGHLLGLTHDSNQQCPLDAQRRSVMASIVPSTLYNFTWSKCSKEQFHEKSKRWWCLHERSPDEGVVLGGTKELTNYIFTMDEQCRNNYGEGYSVCRLPNLRVTCSMLWCGQRSKPPCWSKGAPPIEGTPCGHNKWCVNTECEPMPGHGEKNGVKPKVFPAPTPPAPPHWEEWGKWSNCSASCGYGLRARHRNCIYKGTKSDTACEGAGSQMITCWAGACAARRDQRADFCGRRSRHLIPFVQDDESKQCEGWCIDYSGGTPSKLGTLADGTPCSYERHFDICYQGTCVRGQCNSSDTTCNWCPDGNCNNNTYYYTKQLRKGWTGVAVIPHGAHQLSVHITTPVSLRIAFREKKRENRLIELNKHGKRYEIEENNYLKYDPTVPQNLQIIEVDSTVIDIKEGGNWRREGGVVAAGSSLRYTHTDTDVFISAHSRLYTDLMIMAILEHPEEYEGLVTVEVSVNYSTPAGRARPMAFRWPIERGPCSASCGGGIRIVQQRCPRAEHCPPPRFETCNRHSCEFHWSPGEWEECSATCGDSGVQERQLFCVPVNVSISSRRELIRNSVSPALCLSDKPNKEQPCNRIPCPVYWQEMPWTQCSTTCGRGVSYRPLTCPAPDEMLCGPKPRERRRRCRLRRCPRTPTCPSTDAPQYCELFPPEDLQHHCQGPPFRKYCCNACKHADAIEHRGDG